VQTDVLAVPGDLTPSTETITGENIYKAGSGTGRPVFFGAGRQVFNFDMSELSPPRRTTASSKRSSWATPTPSTRSAQH
jgi:hypothetical protein